MPLRIDAPDGRHYAVLDDTEEGVAVAVWRTPTARFPGKLIGRRLIDCPWHVALDRVHAILQQPLED